MTGKWSLSEQLDEHERTRELADATRPLNAENKRLRLALKELVEAADDFESHHISCGDGKGANNNRLLDAIIAAHQAMETPL
jgi:hypothetical protein